jgi:hypothetical protein
MSLAVSIPPAPWGSGPPPLSRGEVVAQANQLLRNHDYERGWLGFEARTLPGRRGFQGTLGDLRNRVVLVRGEMGHGDCLLFMRYIPLLQKHSGCRQLLLEAAPGMESLFRTYFPDCEVISALPREVVVRSAYIRIMSLPMLLGPVIGWAPVPPLPVPAALVSANRRGIGLCGSCLLPQADGRRARVCDFAPFHLEDFADWHEQQPVGRPQKNPPVHLVQQLKREFGPFTSLLHEDLGFGPWLETAKTIAGLKLVITVDTAVAHLAASLGVPTWVLQRHADQGACWRWSDPNWYPSARVFQQPRPGAWKLVFKEVAAALREGEIKR